MLDIIGNIKIDESKPERIAYLVASIRSLHFLKKECRFMLNLTTPSKELYNIVAREMKSFYNGSISSTPDGAPYGETYCRLITNHMPGFILNFLEDHFTVIDDPERLRNILYWMCISGTDVMKCSFWKIEQNSTRELMMRQLNPGGRIFRNSAHNHALYCKHYGSRFYLGVNFITTTDFALRFWNRNLGPRPHEYEIPSYSAQWIHTSMIPGEEIQCAIDDDHGEPGTCLLKRQEPKWIRIYEEVCRELGLQPNSELPTPNSALS